MAAPYPKYWTSTSPSSPSHILQTPHHAAVALCGLGGFISFSLALVGKKPFDASLSAGIVVLCLYIYTMHSERCRQKTEFSEGFTGVSVLSTDGRSKKAANDGTSELDLTGYATTLGVSIRNGVVHKEGSTLNKILMDALAKEYLRCVTALKSYQSAFGPLQEDLSEAPARTVFGPPMHPTDPSHTDHLNTTITSLKLDLGGMVESAANTPRSPTGIESPDQKRCRARNEKATPSRSSADALLSALEGSSPAPAAPANTPAAAPSGDIANGFASSLDVGPLNHVEEQPQAEEPEEPEDPWSLNDVRAESPGPKFEYGLFGSRKVDSL